MVVLLVLVKCEQSMCAVVLCVKIQDGSRFFGVLQVVPGFLLLMEWKLQYSAWCMF